MKSTRAHKKIILTIIIVFISFGAIILLILSNFSFVFSFFQPKDKTTEQTETWQSIWNKDTSRIEKFNIPFGQSSRRVEVYLPKDYDTNIQTTYPTLYLLHGKGGDETDWLNKGEVQKTLDEAIDNNIIEPLVVVLPDGNGSKNHHTQYINAADGSELNEDLIYKDLVELITKKYRTKNDSKFRAIGGNSAGGFGSLNIGLKHQDVFGEVMSFSGYGHLLTYSSPSLIQNSKEVIDNNSPLTYISKLKTKNLKIWLTIGSGDSSAFIEDNYKLKKSLDRVDINNQLTVTSGAHDWNFWKSHLGDGLSWLGLQWRDRG